MKQPFLMPKLGLTMTEGLVAEWSLRPGDRFARKQTVFVVETDKAANEIAAESAGVLLEIVQPVGATVAVGELVGFWEDGNSADDGGVARVGGDMGNGVSSVTDEATPLPAEPTSVADPPATPILVSDVPGTGAAVRMKSAHRIVASPLARRTAERRGVDIAAVPGSGPGGRIVARDLNFAGVAHEPGAATEFGAGTSRVELTGVQMTMARRMSAAKQEVPHFYLAVDFDMGPLVALRARLNVGRNRRITINHFIVAAVGRALEALPPANRVWADGAALQFTASDVGIAIHTERGLYAPIVRAAGTLSLDEVARQSGTLADRARAGRLTAAELAGGAVTVSNAGMFNVRYLTPIVNPGQAMILGVGSIQQVFRPDAKGRPELRQEMGIVLACDHRILDGVAALAYLNRIVDGLQKTEAYV